jgi:hypothetical protein
MKTIRKALAARKMINPPKGHTSAMKGGHAERWKAAEDTEWNGMMDQDTFEDVLIDDLPPHTKAALPALAVQV